MKILVSLMLTLDASAHAATAALPNCEPAVLGLAEVDSSPIEMVHTFRELGFTELTKIASQRGVTFLSPKRSAKPGPRAHVVRISKFDAPVIEYANLIGNDRLSQFELARALFNVELWTRLGDRPTGLNKLKTSLRVAKNRDHRLDLVNALLAEMYTYVMTLDSSTIHKVLPAKDPGRYFKRLRSILFGGPMKLAPNVSDLETIFALPDVGRDLLRGTINERYGPALGAGAWRSELLAKAPQVLVTAMVVGAIGAGAAYAHAVHYEAAMQMQPGDMVHGGVAAGYDPADPGYRRVKYHFLKARHRLDLAHAQRAAEDFDPFFAWSNPVKVARHREIAAEIDAARAALDRIVEDHPRIIADLKLKAEYNRP